MSVVSQVAAYILQGAALVVIAKFIYSADKHGFWMSGAPQTKEMAQLVIAGVFLATGVGGGILLNTIGDAIAGFSDLQLIGIVAIVSRGTVNMMIDRWNHDDENSLVVYAVSALLIIGPSIVS